MINKTVQYREIDSEHAGQRVDNFLFCQLKGVPKSRIYRLLRKGEIRINKKRVKPEYRLQEADQVRIPPLRYSDETEKVSYTPSQEIFKNLLTRILYEDQQLLIINKPSGLPVHGGSHGPQGGIIETLRHYFPHGEKLELVHRLDKETTGCLIIAKKRSALRELHALLREGDFQKHYMALVKGIWPNRKKIIEVPLLKSQLRSGERMVTVNSEGKPSLTYFDLVERFAGPLQAATSKILDSQDNRNTEIAAKFSASLIEARPHTGRTHQIRVHAAYAEHPIAGDEKYGDKAFNRCLRDYGLKRLFLHASAVSFKLPSTGELITVKADMDEQLERVIVLLRGDESL